MSLRPARGVLVALAAAGLALVLFQHALGGPWFELGVHPEVLDALERSRDDQKALARLDPAASGRYRARFEELQTLVGHLLVLAHNRERVVRRFGLLLLGLFGGVAGAVTVVSVIRQGRHERRLARLQAALAELSAGRPDVVVGDRRRDLLGRIAAMVEDASRVMARDRRRLAALHNLAAWQEAARRHAHEMRTPLTAARLELDRLRDEAARTPDPELAGRLAERAASLGAELERLSAFTRGFTSFARLPRPRLEAVELGALAREIATAFAAAWPGVELVAEGGGPAPAAADREMLRRVVVNLCDNSAAALLAAGKRSGRIRLAAGGGPEGSFLTVTDDGPGVSPELADRIFEPYVTTRKLGEGMGLGLAIAKKALLDHGGDIELVSTGPGGTVFRLSLPPPEAAPTEESP